MTAWLLWFFAAPHLVLLDGVLFAHSPVRIDVGTAMCLVFAVHARTSSLPGLLFCAALGRALLLGGDVALHFSAMAVPVAALLPLRTMFFRRSPMWQCAAAAFLAITVPKVSAFLATVSSQATDVVATVGAIDVVLAGLLVPGIAWLLRSAPPLSLFVERGE